MRLICSVNTTAILRAVIVVTDKLLDHSNANPQCACLEMRIGTVCDVARVALSTERKCPIMDRASCRRAFPQTMVQCAEGQVTERVRYKETV